MTIWTRHQVDQVRGVRAAVVLDPELMSRAKDTAQATAEVRRQLARQIIEACYPFAVVVDPRDIEFNTESVQFGIRVEARWRPCTDEVEFVGGPADGSVYAVQDAPRRAVVVAVASDHPNYADSLAVPSAYDDSLPQRVAYRLTGWHEGARRWVYGTG